MKKIRALLAIILALSLLFATQVTAFAAEEDIGEGHENEALVEEAHTAAGSEEPSEVVPRVHSDRGGNSRWQAV